MATKYHNLSSYDAKAVPEARGMRFGIVCSEWNDHITYALRDGAVKTLMANGVSEDDIDIEMVPGSFELIYGCQALAQTKRYDAIIAIGCVVRGDTPHFDYICAGTTQGIAHLNATQPTPVVYSVLTTNSMEQAEDRAGGRLGNKGDEGAITAIKMANLRKRQQ